MSSVTVINKEGKRETIFVPGSIVMQETDGGVVLRMWPRGMSVGLQTNREDILNAAHIITNHGDQEGLERAHQVLSQFADCPVVRVRAGKGDTVNGVPREGFKHQGDFRLNKIPLIID